MIPSQQDNPDGLYQRYIVSKVNDRAVDPEAVYFVLRLDSGGDDPAHVRACREAARKYAEFVQAHVPSLAKVGEELRELIEEFDGKTVVD